jgi:cell division protein FtsA
VLVGEAREDGHLMVTGVGESPSRGVRKGEIIDFDNALSCVRSALDTAEEQSQVAIRQSHVVVSGAHIRSTVNRGSVPVLAQGGEITAEAIDNVMAVGRAVSLSEDREIIHTICQHFFVDDQKGVVNPEGMEGSKLSVDMLILHCIRNRVRNTVRVVKSAGVDVQDVAFGGLCSGLAVLTGEQKESGVLVIDLGGGTTDYLAYGGKAIACAGSLAVGGDHVTNDIALGLRIPMSQAERLKIDSGNAVPDPKARGQTIMLPAEGGFPERFVKLEDLQTIVHARMEETLSMVKEEMQQYELVPHLGAGVILTGGGAHMRNVKKLAEKVFDLPCTLGQPKGVSGLAVVTEGPDYAAPIGMVRYGFKTGGRAPQGGVLGRIVQAITRR